MNNQSNKIIDEEERKILRFDTKTGQPIYEGSDNVVGYNPNTGEPIYSGSENLMTDKKNKRVIGFDSNTGFPIYEDSNSINVKKMVVIKMSAMERILCIVMYIAASIFAFYGFMVMWCGITAGILLVAFALIDIAIYKKQLKSSIDSTNNQDNEISINNRYKIVYILTVIIFFVVYIAMCSQYNTLNADGEGWNDASGGGAGWFALLMFWPVYIASLVGLVTVTLAYLDGKKKEIRKKNNL